MLNVLQRLTKLTRQSINKFDTMQLLTNLFVLAQQLSLTSGLRVIDNGLGPPVWSSEENGVADYALQAIDKKAALPSQVQAMCHFWYFPCSVHHLLVCNNICFADQPCLLSSAPSVWESLDYTILVSYAWQRGSHIQINGRNAYMRIPHCHFSFFVRHCIFWLVNCTPENCENLRQKLHHDKTA